MTRSHPPGLLTRVRRTLRERCGLQGGDSVLVAVSGGGDSMALLHAFSRLGPELELSVAACGIDHGLRAEAGAELDLAAEHAQRWGVPFYRHALSVEPGGNLQARAREARYAALHEVRNRLGIRYLATAHQLEDRAETVLIRILRGAAPRGLGVLPPRSGLLLRPMIFVSKGEVEAHLARFSIPFASDPSNRDARYLRVRIRQELMPLLRELSPSVASHLAALAEEFGAAELPTLYDACGEEIRLGRGQREALRRALDTDNRRLEIRLKAGKVVRLCPRTGQPRVEELEQKQKAGDSP